MVLRERVLEVDLHRAMDGSALISALHRICTEHGWQLDYLPVSISVAGLPDAERKLFQNVRVRSSLSTVQVVARSGKLERGEEVNGVSLLPSSKEDELTSVLAELLSEELPRPDNATISKRPVEEAAMEAVPLARDYTTSFRVLVVLQGPWGERIAAHLLKARPSHWQISLLRIPLELPPVVDEPDAYVPKELPECDLVLLLSEHSSTPQIASDIILATKAHALIAPIDSLDWFPPGEASKMSRMLGEQGLEVAFPRPFCSLRPSGTPAIDEFAKHFGAPVVEVRSEDGRTVGRLVVNKGAPCGCSEFVAEGMAGTRLEEAVEKAGLLHHHYPCLASMTRAEDQEDTLMHVSGLELKKQVEKEVRRFRRECPSYLDPNAA